MALWREGGKMKLPLLLVLGITLGWWMALNYTAESGLKSISSTICPETPPTPTTTNVDSSSMRDNPETLGEKVAKLRIDYLCTPHIALLPLVAYGGAESSCEAEIEGLSKLYDLDCVEFVAVVPHRDTHGRNYTFPILESRNVGDSGESFIDSYVDDLKRRDKADWPQAIWCQSEWCPITLRRRGINIPVLTTLHYGDCGGCRDFGPSVRYRMPSAHAKRQSINRQGWMAERAFVVWQAFMDSEFEFSPDEGEYFLWVGGCGWYYEKGVVEFQDLARNNPDKKFVLYCGSGHEDKAQMIRAFAQKHPNFEFRGELQRGKPHNEAFAKAKAFFFWTHMGGETFGRVAVEALAKGTPVFASEAAANKELIVENVGGVTTEDVGVVQAALSRIFDRRAVYESAQRFRSKLVVRQLLEETKSLLAWLRQQNVITTDVDDYPVLNFTGYGTPSANVCWQRAT